ncbi:MAG: acetyl-CoA carboxylase biotin carboxyl carrier protein subunit [Candidatus Marinimicrobia bacterium]|nr:acetyl-CoA carboxylase biotin carboxyl carrier protein subunit [Candidatus Neomarinimicrobiota bacterium]
MELYFTYQNQSYKVTVEEEEKTFRVVIGKNNYNIVPYRVSDNVISFDVNGKMHTIYLANKEDRIYAGVRGRDFIFERVIENELEKRGVEEEIADKLVRSQMPGQVVTIDVREGEKVRKNQVLGAVESMKMENEIVSPVNGVVTKIFVKPGQLVDAEEPLIEVE